MQMGAPDTSGEIHSLTESVFRLHNYMASAFQRHAYNAIITTERVFHAYDGIICVPLSSGEGTP